MIGCDSVEMNGSKKVRKRMKMQKKTRKIPVCVYIRFGSCVR